jgi:predicted enzyme involved in methoxymalonyl-ACP biosynthesis
MGRKLEELMASTAVGVARTRALEAVVARYLPTERNRPCLDFWQRSGFAREGDLFRWEAARPYPPPTVLRVLGAIEG